jgi:hypothetical protein
VDTAYSLISFLLCQRKVGDVRPFLNHDRIGRAPSRDNGLLDAHMHWNMNTNLQHVLHVALDRVYIT